MKVCDLCNTPTNSSEHYLYLKNDCFLSDCLKVDLCAKCFYKVRNDIVKKLGWGSDEE